MTSSHRHSSTQKAVVAGTIDTDLTKAIAAHEAKYHAAPAPIPTPPVGIPPVQGGAKFVQNFAGGSLGPFKPQRWPDDHIGQGQAMTEYSRYSNQSYSIHDGYLDMLCEKRADGLWDASFLGTFDEATGFSYQFAPPAYVRWCADFGGSAAKADWSGCWEYGTWLNGDLEADWPETIGGKATGNLHSPDKGQIASVAIPTGWHVWGARFTTTSVSLDLDGTLIAQSAWTVKGPIGLFVDCKVGLAVPDATTGEPRLKVAWVTVD